MLFVLIILVTVPHLNGREKKYPIKPNDSGMTAVSTIYCFDFFPRKILTNESTTICKIDLISNYFALVTILTFFCNAYAQFFMNFAVKIF